MADLSLSRSKENIAALGVPVGTILEYGGTSAPDGYLICDGSSLNRADFPDLFAAIGTAYGTASGSTFNIPDFRGRVARMVDGGAGRDPNAATRGTGGNGDGSSIAGQATGDNVGSPQGDSAALPNYVQFSSGNNSSSHTHSGSTGTVSAWHYHSYTGVVGGSGVGGNGGSWVTGFGTRNTNLPSANHTHAFSTGGVSVNHTHNITGGGDSETRQKNLNVNKIIKC